MEKLEAVAVEKKNFAVPLLAKYLTEAAVAENSFVCVPFAIHFLKHPI